MNFGLTYEQLTPVAGKVRAGLVSYNGDDPEHQVALREALPRFLGTLGAVHGAIFPSHYVDAVIEVANSKIIDIDFFQVGLNERGLVQNAGLATGFQTFGAECDESNNLKFFPCHHGEDLCVDKDVAKLFREYTKCLLYPNGMGAGTWVMREQILRSVSNPYWVYGGRDNEHYFGNPQIIGVMDKFGSIRGSERDSAVLQIDGLTAHMKPRWGVQVVKEDLPSRENIFDICPNNFLTRWSSEDGKQQIAVIFSRSASTFDGHPVVWTKIKSNGNLPHREMLKEVMASLISAGREEISSPNRRWGVPRDKLITGDDLSRIFGGPVPVMHVHMNNEPEILEILLRMEAIYRTFGDRTMVSGVMRLKNMQNPEVVLGQKPPEATQIDGIDPERDANKPYFDVVSEPKKHSGLFLVPKRCSRVRLASRGKARSSAA